MSVPSDAALAQLITAGSATDPVTVAARLVHSWRTFDIDGYKQFLSTKTDWQYVSLILTQWLVGHSAEVLEERAEIETLREMWEAK